MRERSGKSRVAKEGASCPLWSWFDLSCQSKLPAFKHLHILYSTVDRAIARSIPQGWGLRFPCNDRTYKVSKLFSRSDNAQSIPKRGVILLWSALALVINITLSSLCSRRLEVIDARKNGARQGRGIACPRGPWKPLLLAFWECGNLLLVERLPSG